MCKLTAMESPLIELTRVLYHLDYFRRNFRTLAWHRCNNTAPGSTCAVCSFKSLFSELSLLMRESVLDPPHIHHVIESKIEDINWGAVGGLKTFKKNVVSNAVIYESVIRKIEEVGATVLNGTPSNPQTPSPQDRHPGIQLHTEFNVTKICLHCRTTSYVESISQYIMQIDSSSLISNDWPSFEFAIKTALDSEEFCIQPNCHGQTKIFRLLNSLPAILPISFTDPTPGSLITLLPARLRPHLIFEMSKSITDLHLKAVILHSRQWGYATLFHHSRLDLWIFIDSRRVLSLYKTWIESRFHPITYGFVVYYAFYCKEETSSDIVPMSPPVLPVKQNSPLGLPTARLVDYNSKPGFESDHRIYENWPLDNDSGQGSEFSSNCSSSASANSYTRSLSSSSFVRDRDSIPVIKPAASPEYTGTSGADGMSSNNKYATVRRKMKYQRRGKHCGPPNLSLSVPDLSALSSAAATARRSSPHECHEFETSSRTSVDAGNRKVSFNCEVTLVDDLDDEYIPHPIFQSVLKRLQQNLRIDNS